MANFDIYSYEIHENRQVEAPGIAEAMLDYLPWPKLDVSINWSPSNGVYMVTDKYTDFKYKVTLA